VTTPLHDGEADIGGETVRRLLQEESPELAVLPLEPLGNTGSVLLHGDLIPGNLLVAAGRLTSVLDWGGLGAGDPAQDFDPAWAVLDQTGTIAFRENLDIDEASWLRGRGFALEQAIGGVIYYTPRRHPLAEVMQRMLDRLLSGR